MALFRRKKTIQLNPMTSTEVNQLWSGMPDDFAKKCPHCGKILLQKQIREDYTCPNCEEHFSFPARERLSWLLDEASFREWDAELNAQDPIDFPGYQEKLAGVQEKTHLTEAVITGYGRIQGNPTAIAVMDNRFFMGSMGQVVGEKLTRLFEEATQERLPVVIFVTSGGARMQEGIFSLMQMAKVSQAVARHSQAGLFYCSILTHPTTGGVTASFAMQADIILAEPRAIIGFAGKRVIQQTMKMKLKDDFQTSEWVFENGFIDRIVSRTHQRDLIAHLIYLHGSEEGNHE